MPAPSEQSRPEGSRDTQSTRVVDLDILTIEARREDGTPRSSGMITTPHYTGPSLNPTPTPSFHQSTGSAFTSGPSPGDVTTALLDELPEPSKQSEYSREVDTYRRLGPTAKEPGEPLWIQSVYASALNTIANHQSNNAAQRDANQTDWELLKKYPDTEEKAPEIRRVIRKLECEIDPAKLG